MPVLVGEQPLLAIRRSGGQLQNPDADSGGREGKPT